MGIYLTARTHGTHGHHGSAHAKVDVDISRSSVSECEIHGIHGLLETLGPMCI
jgi:hypothetical protein